MSENKPPLDKHDKKVDPITDQIDAQPVDTGIGNGLAKAAIGAVVGAVVGTVAGALANKRTAESINRTVKGVGEAVKGAAEGVNHTVKGAAEAVKGVAEDVAKGVNYTANGTGGTAKGTAEGVNHSVNGAGDTVKGVAEDVKPSVKGTVDWLKDTVEDTKPSGIQGVKPSDHQSLKLYEERLIADKKQVKTGSVVIGKHIKTQTAHISVSVEKEQVVVERITPVDVGTPVAPGEANFREGEAVRMEVYEETADIQKQAFVREELSVRKQVERDTVEVEDIIRREELDLEIQGRNIIDKTKV